jgi:hypothetical protein
MDTETILTEYTRYIPTRILKGGSYLYAQTYFEAGSYGIMALDKDTLAVLNTFTFEADRISDFCVYSDNRIAVRSDNRLAVLSFDGNSFDVVASVGIRSTINMGVACNSTFAYASCGSKIICMSISTGEIIQEYNVQDSYNSRDICCTEFYLFVRKCLINFKGYKLAVYRINNDYIINPEKNISLIDEIDSPAFDLDLGKLTLDGTDIIETGLRSNRLVNFNGTSLTVINDLTPFYPALEFVKFGSYYFISPDTKLRVLIRSGTWGVNWVELYSSTAVSKQYSYKCPGFIPTEFYSTRDILGDGTGRNVSKNLLNP